MKITSQEEYGLRILLRIAQSANSEGLTIPQISEIEGLSQHYVAKLCRILRIAGFINSSRGKDGGYFLSKPAKDIQVNAVLESLGGRLYTPHFCGSHSGVLKNCSHPVDCSVRSLWQKIQSAVDGILYDFSLQDLLGKAIEYSSTAVDDSPEAAEKRSPVREAVSD